ncbi:MAG: molybdate ABC transporter substrate-binding protein, partial [Actinomycetota bacterium]|nr:molybdate ABC transporter substrate-binding protein [Actinomycetota bacterium]
MFVGVAMMTAACGADRETSAPSPQKDPIAGTLAVFAAASLTEAFTELGATFEAEHPNLQVAFNFAASSALARQINEGAPADVFASADVANMKKLTDADSTGETVVVARNRLSIIVEPGNPKRIAGLADLAKAD